MPLDVTTQNEPCPRRTTALGKVTELREESEPVLSEGLPVTWHCAGYSDPGCTVLQGVGYFPLYRWENGVKDTV